MDGPWQVIRDCIFCSLCALRPRASYPYLVRSDRRGGCILDFGIPAKREKYDALSQANRPLGSSHPPGSPSIGSWAPNRCRAFSRSAFLTGFPVYDRTPPTFAGNFFGRPQSAQGCRWRPNRRRDCTCCRAMDAIRARSCLMSDRPQADNEKASDFVGELADRHVLARQGGESCHFAGGQRNFDMLEHGNARHDWLQKYARLSGECGLSCTSPRRPLPARRALFVIKLLAKPANRRRGRPAPNCRDSPQDRPRSGDCGTARAARRASR